MRTRRFFPPGSTIGIFGGGQLGRMMILAAVKLGYKCRIFCKEANSPAQFVATSVTIADYDNLAALNTFSKKVDIVTLEFENIPLKTIQFIEKKVPTQPSSQCLKISQDRVLEKTFISKVADVTPFHQVDNQATLQFAAKKLGYPVMLKTRQFGYDGKGQVLVEKKSKLNYAWKKLSKHKLILESCIQLKQEISVIVARKHDGTIVIFPPTENQHSKQILHSSRIPANISKKTERKVKKVAERICTKLKLVGILAVEFFISHTGQILVNEIAPRPHNSGHWTLDGCSTSQFEQHIRAICGLPFGPTNATHDVEMQNLLGKDIKNWKKLLSEPNARLHVYDKDKIKRDRKMGHVNRLYPLGSTKAKK
ncbi:MAG: 5-(carboxyamino)imidazole ribonucleotide synthase [Magnetovibrio sp.]|nr:5-(carboxyamino)imidazole ribonucleotide synthase [Magnetovibrio sp.]